MQKLYYSVINTYYTHLVLTVLCHIKNNYYLLRNIGIHTKQINYNYIK